MSAAELQAVTIREPEQLTAREVRAQVNLVQEVMKGVMQQGTHYGKVPGCGDKPTLLKPGAEKLASTFRLAINPEIEDLSSKDLARYRIKTIITHQITGAFLGAGVGECSSAEEKYYWRTAVCDEEYNDTPEDRRRIKYKKNYGKIERVKQVRVNPADVANIVLKIAKKRSLVDGILTVTAASDIFTQDIEDLPEELIDHRDTEKPKRETKTVADTQPQGQDQTQPRGNGVITDPQRKRLYAIAKNAGYSDEQFKQIISACGYSSSTEILKKHYEVIVESIEGTPIDQLASTIDYLSKWCKEN